MTGEKETQPEEKNLWQSILKDVSKSTTSHNDIKKTILVVGDEGSGKSTLIARLQDRKYNKEEHPTGTGLEYTYLIKEEEDLSGRFGIYSLDGNVVHKNLLSFVANKDTIEDNMFVIVVDMSRPWLIMNSLQKWVNILKEHIESLGIEEEKMTEMRTNVAKSIQKYLNGSSGESEEDDELPQLEEGVLEVNLGVPLMVICNKCDAANNLEKDRDYRNEHFDFIQMNLRKFCVKYGAALFYSGNGIKTTERITNYILGFSCPDNNIGKLRVAHDISSRDAVAIPAGWDDYVKIQALYSGLKHIKPDDRFSEHIIPPLTRKAAAAQEVRVEDEQEFLMRQQDVLAQNKDGGAAGPSRPNAVGTGITPAPSATGRSPAASTTTRTTTRTGPATPSGAPAAGANAKGNSDVLANFFQSLLNNKPAPKKEEK